MSNDRSLYFWWWSQWQSLAAINPSEAGSLLTATGQPQASAYYYELSVIIPIICVTLRFTELSRHKRVQRDLAHDSIQGMMPAWLWRVTVVIIIKGAETGHLMLSHLCYLQSPPTVCSTLGSRFWVSSQIPRRLVTRVYSTALKFYLTLVNIQDLRSQSKFSGSKMEMAAARFPGIVWTL